MKDAYELTSQIKRLIRDELKYYTPRMGQVVSLTDPLAQGRVKVTIPILGWFTPDQGIWAYPGQPRGVINPAIDDWVIVQFIDGKPDKCVYYGQAYFMKNMLPANYSGKDNQVIFEGRENSTHISYNETTKKMEIGNSLFQPAARKEDPVFSDITLDAVFWGWVTNISAVVNGLLPGSVPSIPTTQTGKINGGSSQVDIGDK